MNTRRMIAALCAAVLMLACAVSASAEISVANRFAGEYDNYYTLENGKTVKFCVEPESPITLYLKGEDDEWGYTDVIYDTASTVKAYSKADWISSEDYKGESHLYIWNNTSDKDRTAEIICYGNGYNAKIQLTQWGCSQFTSIVRNKKKVTVKIKPAQSAKSVQLAVYRSKSNSDGTLTYGVDYVPFNGKKSVSFTVKAGWSYTLQLVSEFSYASGDAIVNAHTCMAFFDVDKDNIKKKEEITW